MWGRRVLICFGIFGCTPAGGPVVGTEAEALQPSGRLAAVLLSQVLLRCHLRSHRLAYTFLLRHGILSSQQVRKVPFAGLEMYMYDRAGLEDGTSLCDGERSRWK